MSLHSSRRRATPDPNPGPTSYPHQVREYYSAVRLIAHALGAPTLAMAPAVALAIALAPAAAPTLALTVTLTLTLDLRALYGLIHRRHHEHKSPHVWTNYHFTAADLFTEGFAPFGVGLAALEGLVALFGPVAAVYLRPSRLVLLLLLSHIMWYEICSHAGKPVPTASVYPPLSLVYNAAARLARWPRRCRRG